SYNIKRAFNDQGRLTLFDRRRNATRRLASKLDRATGHHEWAPDGLHLYLIVEDRGRHALFRLGLDDALPSPIAAGGVIGGYALARDGTRIVFDRATLSHPPALFTIQPDTGNERPIETVNRALLARVRLGETREFTVKGWRGNPVQVWVTYPPSFDPK